MATSALVELFTLSGMSNPMPGQVGPGAVAQVATCSGTVANTWGVRAGEMKDPAVGADLERVMDQAVGISLGQEPPAAVGARLRALAAAQGTRWDADSEEASPVVGALQSMPVRPAPLRALLRALPPLWPQQCMIPQLRPHQHLMPPPPPQPC